TSYNYLITNNLVNEARFGLSFWQFQTRFPVQGAAAISALGLSGLDLSDHPTTGAFPIFNFSDDSGNYSPIGRDKDGITKSQTIQFADNLSWIKGRHTMKFGVDVRRVRYQDLESFGGADDFGAFTFDQGVFTGNAFANLLLGLPTKTYLAQSGPDVHAHTIQTGVYAQDEFRVNDRFTLTYGLRWQGLPHSLATSAISPHLTFVTVGSSFQSAMSRGPASWPASTVAIPPIPQIPLIHAARLLPRTPRSAACPSLAQLPACPALGSSSPIKSASVQVYVSSTEKIFSRASVLPIARSATTKPSSAAASAFSP